MTRQNNSHDDNPKKLVVIYTPPGMTGHLIPAVELGNLLVAQGLEVTMVMREEGDGAGGSFHAATAAANPSISFHYLPAAMLPSHMSAGSEEAKPYELARASNPDLSDFLQSASPAALIIDFFCSSALDIGADLCIPTYFFLTTCIGSLAFMLYQRVIHEQTTLSFRDLGGELVHTPGLPPIPADHVSAALLDRDSLSYKRFLELSAQVCNSQGVIVNSFRSLEPRAAEAIVSGRCAFPGWRTPPLYCIGPLIKPEDVGAQRHECLAWLDGHAKDSVVFLCFGSLGRFSAKQIKQIAAGLEQSGQRFLWAMTRPPGDQHQMDSAILPEGFLQRTKDRGLVVMSWAPQREVLAHEAVGGFVTHCGWNSVLESVGSGVPILAWPLYAEQRMNKVFLVEEMRLAGVIEGYEKELVEAQEVAAKVTWLIESDGGRELRQRTQVVMQRAKEALRDDGESKAALVNLATQWKCPDNGIIN